MQNDTVLEVLRNKFESLERARDPDTFFFLLSDFVSYIMNSKELFESLQILEREEDVYYSEQDMLESLVEKDFDSVCSAFLEVEGPWRCKEKNLSVFHPMRKLEAYQNGDLRKSGYAHTVRRELLADVGNYLVSCGYSDVVDPYIYTQKDSRVVCRFSESYNRLLQVNAQNEKNVPIELFSSWRSIEVIPEVLRWDNIFLGENYDGKLGRDMKYYIEFAMIRNPFQEELQEDKLRAIVDMYYDRALRIYQHVVDFRLGVIKKHVLLIDTQAHTLEIKGISETIKYKPNQGPWKAIILLQTKGAQSLKVLGEKCWKADRSRAESEISRVKKDFISRSGIQQHLIVLASRQKTYKLNDDAFTIEVV